MDDIVQHDAESGAIAITFERFENEEDDVVLPNFRVTVSTSEHVLAWVESLLRAKKCKRVEKTPNEKRLQSMLRNTQQDRELVYLCGAQHHVVVIRNGRVLKVPFASEPLNRFLERLGESPTDDCTVTTNSEFATFVKGLMK